MQGWGLNLLYALLLTLLSPLLLYRSWKQGKYRQGGPEKLWGRLPMRQDRSRPLIWLHAVSVGEVLQLQQVIRELQSRAEIQALITTTTQTGHRVALEKFPQCQVAYFPLDFSWAVQRAITRVDPDLVVLVELEIWPNFLRALSSRKIPVALINGRLSERSYRGYRRIRRFAASVLRSIDLIVAQSADDAERFRALGAPEDSVIVSGSIKFDGAATQPAAKNVQALRQFFQLDADGPVFVAGSTQDPEESLALAAYDEVRKSCPRAQLILAPRHPERGDAVAQLIAQKGYGCIRRSTGSVSFGERGRIGLLDTVGELKACWGLADVAFVGGSFGNRGGQNMLEPAALGVPTCFGPNTKNFRQVVELLLANQAAMTVTSQAELTDFVRTVLLGSGDLQRMGQRAKKLIEEQQGATQLTVDLLLERFIVRSQADHAA